MARGGKVRFGRKFRLEESPLFTEVRKGTPLTQVLESSSVAVRLK